MGGTRPGTEEGEDRWLDEMPRLLADIRRICRKRAGQPGPNPAVACPLCGRENTAYSAGQDGRGPVPFTCPHCGLKIMQ